MTADCYNEEQKCPYLKEKWIETHEEGTTFWMFETAYCTLNECAFKDFPKPWRFNELMG